MGRIFLIAVLNIPINVARRRADRVHTPVKRPFCMKTPFSRRSIQILRNSNPYKIPSPPPSSPPQTFVIITRMHDFEVCFFESLHPRPDHANVDFRFFFLIMTHLWKKKLFLWISVRKATRHLQCERQMGGCERAARSFNTAKIYACQSSSVTKVQRVTIHSFAQHVQWYHIQACRTRRVAQ